MKQNKFNFMILIVLSFFIFAQSFANETSADHDEAAIAFFKEEAAILSPLLKENGYKNPGYAEFRQRCLNYFGFDIQNAGNDYVQCFNGATGCYDLYVQQEFLATFGESVFYDPSKPETPTIEKVNERLRSKNDVSAQQFLAYNKLLFNDDFSVIGFFIQNENRDYVWEAVFRFDYEKNEMLYAAALPIIAPNHDTVATTQHILLYNNPQRGYKKKLLNDFYRVRGGAAIQQILNSTFQNWHRLISMGYDIKPELAECRDIDQPSLDKALLHLFKLLSHHQSDEISLIESERLAYSYFIKFINQDENLKNRFEQTNYYDMGIVVLSQEQRLISPMHNELLKNQYITQSSDGYINLRKEPNSKSEVIDRLPNKTQLFKITAEGNWYYVQVTGSDIKGFIHNSQLLYVD